MKKVIYMFAVYLVIFAGVQTGHAFPEFITVDSRNNANLSNDSTVPLAVDYTDGFSVLFPAGTYTFSVYDGAWNPWGDVDLARDRGWVWSMDIYQPSVGGSSIWLGSNTPRYATPADALNGHFGESITLNLPVDEDLYFYIGDGANASDNLGTVTARVNNAVPEPATMLLFGSGLVGAFIKRRRKA